MNRTYHYNSTSSRTPAAKKKAQFRRSAKWKKFRARLKKERKLDELTGKPLINGWQLHHLDLNEENYRRLEDETHFACLNKTGHEFIHWLWRYDWRKVLESAYSILERMEEINAGN